MATKQKNYINNHDFHEALVEYKKMCELASKKKQPKPQIPNYLGECWMLIAERLSHKPNFRDYTFREEMIGDGIENCLMYFENFDTTYKNPFAYFTQIIYYAFLRRIAKEKKQLYVKYKATVQIGLMDEHEMMEFEDGTTVQFQLYDNIGEFIETYENAHKKKKEENKPKGIEKFLD